MSLQKLLSIVPRLNSASFYSCGLAAGCNIRLITVDGTHSLHIVAMLPALS